MKKYDGVIKRVREIEWKYGIAYPRPDEKPYKLANFFYVIFFLWANVMNVMHLLSIWVKSGESDAVWADFGNGTTFIGVCAVALIIAMTLRRFKNIYCHIGSFVITLAASVGLLLTYAPWFEDLTGFLGYKLDFYIRHVVPIVLMVILLGVLVYIYVNAELKTAKTYKKVVEGLYEKYGADKDGIAALNDSEWEEFVKNYDPRIEKENRKSGKKKNADE